MLVSWVEIFGCCSLYINNVVECFDGIWVIDGICIVFSIFYDGVCDYDDVFGGVGEFFDDEVDYLV